jgi:hypothetical protein
MRELSPLTFTVNIDRYVVILAIHLFWSFKDLIVCSQSIANLCLFFSCDLRLPILL